MRLSTVFTSLYVPHCHLSRLYVDFTCLTMDLVSLPSPFRVMISWFGVVFFFFFFHVFLFFSFPTAWCLLLFLVGVQEELRDISRFVPIPVCCAIFHTMRFIIIGCSNLPLFGACSHSVKRFSIHLLQLLLWLFFSGNFSFENCFCGNLISFNRSSHFFDKFSIVFGVFTLFFSCFGAFV